MSCSITSIQRRTQGDGAKDQLHASGKDGAFPISRVVCCCVLFYVTYYVGTKVRGDTIPIIAQVSSIYDT